MRKKDILVTYPNDTDELMAYGGNADDEGGSEKYKNMLATRGRYICQITALDKDTRPNYDNPAVMDPVVRITYEPADTPRNRKKNVVGTWFDELVPFAKNMANPKAKLGHRYAAATGIKPLPKTAYPLRRDMVGRYVMVELDEKHTTNRETGQESVWPRVLSVSFLEDDDYEDNGLDAPAAPRAKAEDLYPPQPAAPAPRKPVVTATATRRGAPPPDDDEDEDEDD